MDSTGRDTRFSQPVLEVDGQPKTYAESDYGPNVVSDYGLDFMEKSHKQGKPFLLYYPMILTHCPLSPTPNSPDWMKNDTAVMRYRGEPQYFADMVAYTDKTVGKINQKLEELGIKENTLLIFTGDNGTDRPIVSMLNGRQVAGAKNQSTDAGTRVPLLRGDSSLHRKWIYSCYSRSGEAEKAQVFVRNQRYKLYDSGEFYEVPWDYTEQNPLEVEALGSEARETRQMLQSVLDRYKVQRLNRVPSSGQ